ncbi:MAG: hypothetical protein KF774_05805 [Planctomyces sp.]|nr:hypothetical protein [Planctomyces sp.]
MPVFHRPLLLLAIIGAMAFANRPVQALDVLRVDWGFDGRIVLKTFNPVTVEVINNSRTPFEGPVQLEIGATGARDLPHIEPDLFIEPGGVRRIQFFPYIEEQWSEFSLSWGPHGEFRRSLTDPAAQLRSGPPATVLIRDGVSNIPFRSRLPVFDAQDFPVSVSGTTGLKAALLDQAPRWDALRAQAFRDWLAAGGTVHLLHDATGGFPTFSAPLEVLNEPSDVIPVGAGQVVRHPRQVAQIDEGFLQDSLQLLPPQAEALTPERVDYNYGYNWSVSSSLAPLLRSLTRPDHSWSLIFLLSFAYLGVVFPGCWLIGRRRADFRISYPVLLGAVLIFSLAFNSIGQRGYGEQTAWNSVAIARPLGEGRWVIECLDNSFVTSGGQYDYAHEADGLIYSTGGTPDTRQGFCRNRPGAMISVEIPPYSSQTLLHTGVVKGPDFHPRIVSFDATSSPPTFALAWSGTPPAEFNARAIYGQTMYTLQKANAEVRSFGPQTIESVLSGTGHRYRYVYQYEEGGVNARNVYNEAELPLIGQCLGIRNDQQLPQYSHPAGRLRVLVYAPMPQEFLEMSQGPQQRHGYVLYSFDLPVDAAPDVASPFATPASTEAESTGEPDVPSAETSTDETASETADPAVDPADPATEASDERREPAEAAPDSTDAAEERDNATAEEATEAAD